MSKKKKKSSKKPAEDDRSLLEVSNDEGDHWVADIPTKGVKATEKSLKDAGAIQDKDDKLKNVYGAARIVEARDSKQYRYRSERVIDEGEDLEDTYDREEDKSDLEPDSDEEPDADSEASEQSSVWKFW